jgi:hypothetical protein
MIKAPLVYLALIAALPCAAVPMAGAAERNFTDTFGADTADLSSTGTNRFFILVPGYQAVLEGKEDGRATVLTITVLNETKTVDGVETRVVEEREVGNGQTVEISRNYFAISRRTGDVFYFGEDSDTYKNGEVSSHEGSWLAGVAGARFGLAMPGTPLLGARYYQELAPKVAMDRAEIVSLNEKLKTAAGNFENCLKTEETSAVEMGREYKLYAAGIGLIQDARLKLTKSGFKNER